MAAAFGGYFGLERHSEQSEIADDVEDLVADKFVVEAERRFVEHSVGRENNCIIERAAESEIRFAEHFDLVSKAESAS